MAQIIQNKYPIDTEARKAVGFGFPLNGNAVFVPTYQTRDQIKANLVNYLLTNRGERVFNPNFGADLRNLLFENILDTTTEDLRERIQNDISLYFPEVQVRQIIFDNIPDTNTINFTLTYEVVLFGIEESVNILLQ
jgi:phage baseplate assembly protein W